MQRAHAQIGAITLPVLFLIADQDRLVIPSELVSMSVAIPSVDKEVVRFPDAFHEILNEVGRQQTYQRLLTWLAMRFGAAAAA
jgi:alpha-beta hydrolase superfamily lysophospholipase